jgi:hypothetical protein
MAKMTEAKSLKIEAANCRRLAETIKDEQGRRKLESLADSYDAEAAALEIPQPA